MPDYAIRDAVESDCGRLIELMRELAVYEKLDHIFVGAEEDMKKWLFSGSPAAAGFVAEKDGVIVGYAIYFRSFSTFLGKPGIWLEDLYVSPALRGQGIGKALLKRLAVTAAEGGHARLEWSVLDWNQPAIDFYAAIGAEIMGEWRICRMDGERLSRFAASDAIPTS
jgi:GNAT superfamily N-acetyltransferase